MSLSYEKLCELRDSGFPQDVSGRHMFDTGEVIGFEPFHQKAKAVYFPSLEEVIEELGDSFSILVKAKTGEWYADQELGISPLEAVVNLYIAVNGKKV